MNYQHSYSVTVEEAVALLVNIDEVPIGNSILQVTAAGAERAATGFQEATAIFAYARNQDGPDPDPEAETEVEAETEAEPQFQFEAENDGPSAEALAGALFEGTFRIACEEVHYARALLASGLVAAFQRELNRPGPSLLVQVPQISAVPRFTVESVNRWATKYFGLRIPGLEVQKIGSRFYQSPERAREDDEPALTAPVAAAGISDTEKASRALKPDGLKRVAAEHLYVTMAYLTEAYVDKSGPGLRLNGGINILKTATALSDYITADPSSIGLGGQSTESIMTRMEDAQDVKQKKLRRL